MRPFIGITCGIFRDRDWCPPAILLRKTYTDAIVKAGGVPPSKLATNDNLTIVRAAKPAKKDLPAAKDVKGGGLPPSKIATNDSLTIIRAPKPAKKDLPAGQDVKAGGKRLNDNLTLVRTE